MHSNSNRFSARWPPTQPTNLIFYFHAMVNSDKWKATFSPFASGGCLTCNLNSQVAYAHTSSSRCVVEMQIGRELPAEKFLSLSLFRELWMKQIKINKNHCFRRRRFKGLSHFFCASFSRCRVSRSPLDVRRPQSTSFYCIFFHLFKSEIVLFLFLFRFLCSAAIARYRDTDTRPKNGDESNDFGNNSIEHIW